MWTAIILIVLFSTAVVMLSDEVNIRWGYVPLVLSIGGLIFSSWAASRVPTHTITVNDKTEIVALSNGTQISGEYFLLAGSINQSPVYYYFKKTGDGGFVQDSISANNLTIYQDTISDGYILHSYQYKSVNDNFREKWRGWVWWSTNYGNINDNTSIHVPPNSIIQQYQIDLSKQ